MLAISLCAMHLSADVCIMPCVQCIYLQMSLCTVDSFFLCIDYYEDTYPVRPNDLFIYLVCLLLLQLHACILLKRMGS
jgi:hypothetical protein